MKSHAISMLALGSFALGACASTPGASPLDMTAAQHEQAAGAAEAQSKSHRTQNDQSAPTYAPSCGGPNVCWTFASNLTTQHAADSERYQKMAADHRAGAQALRDAETRACVGISESDRDMSPFYHRQDILSIEASSRRIAIPYDGAERGNPPQVSGAVVTFRALPGMTVEWLQRVVDCHLARNSAVGNNMPEMSYCPLAVKGVSATVSSARGGFAVAIEASDRVAIQEVLRRAQALKNPG